MRSLKGFLYEVAPVLGMTGGALYERQRALVKLGALESVPGRGRRTGVELTAESFAAVLISVLAAEGWSDVDERVVALFKAPFGGYGTRKRSADTERRFHRADFLGVVAKAFAGTLKIGAMTLEFEPSAGAMPARVVEIRVSRVWRGQIVVVPETAFERRQNNVNNYFVRNIDGHAVPRPPVSITAEIEEETFSKLAQMFRDAIRQPVESE
jgi:hypothetical protein